MKIAIYPGSFDPITNGHVNIIERGAKLFDKLYIVLSHNVNKNSFFTLEERVELTKQAVAHVENIEVIVSENKLTVDFAEELGATAILRGLRGATDFDYEFMMTLTNQKLSASIETVFLTADTEHMYLSSSMVKEVAKFGGNVMKFVPKGVAQMLERKFLTAKSSD